MLNIKNLKNNKFKNLISFAYWEFNFDEGKSVINNMFFDKGIITLQNINEQSQIDEFGLKSDYVCLGMNYSTFKEGVESIPDFGNFHLMSMSKSKGRNYTNPVTGKIDTKPLHNDERLALSLYDTSFWGALMLDLICIDKNGDFNGYPESKIQVAKNELKTHESKIKQINGVIEILKSFGSNNPQILCFGNDVYNVMNEYIEHIKKELGRETKLIKTKHYATTTGISHNEYINETIRGIL